MVTRWNSHKIRWLEQSHLRVTSVPRGNWYFELSWWCGVVWSVCCVPSARFRLKIGTVCFQFVSVWIGTGHFRFCLNRRGTYSFRFCLNRRGTYSFRFCLNRRGSLPFHVSFLFELTCVVFSFRFRLSRRDIFVSVWIGEVHFRFVSVWIGAGHFRFVSVWIGAVNIRFVSVWIGAGHFRFTWEKTSLVGRARPLRDIVLSSIICLTS